MRPSVATGEEGCLGSTLKLLGPSKPTVPVVAQEPPESLAGMWSWNYEVHLDHSGALPKRKDALLRLCQRVNGRDAHPRMLLAFWSSHADVRPMQGGESLPKTMFRFESLVGSEVLTGQHTTPHFFPPHARASNTESEGFTKGSTLVRPKPPITLINSQI